MAENIDGLDANRRTDACPKDGSVTDRVTAPTVRMNAIAQPIKVQTVRLRSNGQLASSLNRNIFVCYSIPKLNGFFLFFIFVSIWNQNAEMDSSGVLTDCLAFPSDEFVTDRITAVITRMKPTAHPLVAIILITIIFISFQFKFNFLF